ncbi:hypothetical protein [Aquabacterium parvum]|uniref:hypothetical protein n=1 Tax=Aquabacterium parvum TaxID=70584 RepID=UPI000718C004|nr:hypothetical protein [Aquabacterium parvum]
MDIGTFILLHFATIPLIHEFDHIACKQGSMPRFSQVVALSNFRRQRWAISFGILWLLLLALTISSSEAHPVNLRVFALAFLVQAACWGHAIYRARRKAKNEEASCNAPPSNSNPPASQETHAKLLS